MELIEIKIKKVDEETYDIYDNDSYYDTASSPLEAEEMAYDCLCDYDPQFYKVEIKPYN